MEKQTEEFSDESLRYITTTIGNEPGAAFLKIWQDTKLLEGYRPDHILDVGTGGGAKLQFLVEKFKTKGVGIEVSPDGVALLNEHYKHNENISFCEGNAYKLPFATDSFDLVHVWSVFHWVGRNEYLQSIGESIRVAKKYLMILDFVADKDYRTPYHHQPGFFTYKMDFEALVMNSGIMERIYEKSWRRSHPDNGDSITEITLRDLVPFLGNSANYWSVKAVVFEKNYGLLPSLTAEDFNTQNFKPSGK